VDAPTPFGARRDGSVRGHGWWAPLGLLPVRCHTVTSRQRSLRNTARPRRSPARRRRGRPLCPRSASGRPLTAALGVGNALPAIDDAPGGAKSAPPVINHKEKKPWQTPPRSRAT
jgi:hypothetical protein